MDPATIFQNLVTASPFAGLLFYLYFQERKERRALQDQLIQTLTTQADLGDAVRKALEKGKSNGG